MGVIRYYKFIFLFLLLMNFSAAGVFYVSTNGSDANDGLTEATAWATVKYAATKAVAGDVVYVKAGIYNGERIVFSNDGAADSPILFEGYKDVPGDINSISWWQYGDSLDASKMPLLDGGDRGQGTCFNSNNRHYIEIKNFQITNYSTGISLGWSSSAHHNRAENIIAVNFGKLSSDPEAYYGKGIAFSQGHDFMLKNCTVVNSGAEGISFSSSYNNVIDSCRVYCDQGYSGQPDVNAATDYYMVFSGDNNVIKNCYIERVGDLDHGGAGIGIKGNGENNLFENCTAKNLKNAGFYVRWSGVKNNTFINCTAIGGISGDGFILRDGASHNNFYNCKTEGVFVALGFYFTGEDDSAEYTARYNNFYNCIFKGTKSYIFSFASGSPTTKAVLDNRFVNCVFDGAKSMFSSNRDNSGNALINSVVTNVQYYKYFSGKNVNITYSYTDFWNNDFSLPQDTNTVYDNILEADPKFVDGSNGNYRTQDGSPCIDAGTPDTTGLNLPEYDIYGNVRIFDAKNTGTARIDIGVYEFPVLTDIVINKTQPTEFIVFDNYPNPFNPMTKIAFSLPASVRVQLSVYNILGEKVSELINENMSAGRHEITFDASNLSSGVYLYKISAGNYSAVKSMTLVK